MGGKRISVEYEKCLRNKKLGTIKNGKRLAPKHIKQTEYDLKRAENSLKDKDFKWATAQAYYSMFNCAKALLLYEDITEKNSHACLIAAVKELYVAQKRLDITFVEVLWLAKDLREEANYKNSWDEKSAEKLVKKAKEFIGKAKQIIRNG